MPGETSNDPLLIKVLVIGPHLSGKTKLIEQFVNGKYSETYEATIAVDFKTRLLPKKFEIAEENDQIFKFQIWDASGNSNYDSISRAYIRGAHVVLIAIDLARDPALNQKYLDDLKKDYPDLFKNSDQIKLFVGTKSDHDDTKINGNKNRELMKHFADNNPGFAFYPEDTSAKCDASIDAILNDKIKNGVFIYVARLIVSKINNSNKLNPAENNSNNNSNNQANFIANTKNINVKFSDLGCLAQINQAITLTNQNISLLPNDSKSELINFKTSLENLRTHLTKIYLKRLPSDIRDSLITNKALTEEQQKQLNSINTEDIAEVANQAYVIASSVSGELKKPLEQRTILPAAVEQAVIKMRETFGSVGWRVFAAVVITAVCAIAGAVGGFFLGGIGSIPAATLGTLLGIEITSTLLGVTLTSTAASAGLCTLGIFKSNSYQINECSKDIEFNVEEVLRNTPTLQA